MFSAWTKRIRLIAIIVSSCVVSMLLPLGWAISAEIEVFPGLDSDQRVIIIRGPIEDGDAGRFYEVAEHAPRATVFLMSPGGSVPDALEIGAEVRIRDYATLVLEGEGCFSACALIWVASRRPYMGPNAAIGVHAAYYLWSLEDGTAIPVESGVANADIGAFLTTVGLTRDAVRYFTSASPNSFLPITPDIARSLDINVHIQDGFQTSRPSERPTPRAIAFDTATLTAIAGNCAELFDLDYDVVVAEARLVLSIGHEEFGGEIFAPLIPEMVAAVKNDLASRSFIEWCIEAETRMRANGNTVGITTPGFSCDAAQSEAEKLVCSEPTLWADDRALLSVYRALRAASGEDASAQLLRDQRSWISRRNSCGYDLDCVTRSYRARLIELGGL